MRHLVLTTFLVFISSCGGASFGGAGEGRDGIDSSSQEQDTERFLQKDSFQSDDDQAISNCLKKWGNHPFDNGKNYRKINASVQVLGIGTSIVDEKATNEPALVLIGASVNVLSPSARYRLMNPKGWYCLKVDVNVGSSLNIDLHCNASIMDSKVNVSVFSNAEAAGGVGVSVLSSVKLNRKGTSCR